MVIPGERIAEEEESEDTDTDSVGSYFDSASPGDIGESTPDISSPGPRILSPLHTLPDGKAKKATKDREPFYKGYGVV